jgi:hypothetical protein
MMNAEKQIEGLVLAWARLAPSGRLSIRVNDGKWTVAVRNEGFQDYMDETAASLPLALRAACVTTVGKIEHQRATIRRVLDEQSTEDAVLAVLQEGVR